MDLQTLGSCGRFFSMIRRNITIRKLVFCTLGLSGAAIVASCSGANTGGFGGGGEHVDIVEDTGKHTGSNDTDTDTATTTTTDTGTSVTDTSIDTGDTGDTGVTEPAIEGTGYDRGDTAHNLIAPDQNDIEWQLHSQIGEVIVLLIGDGYDSNFTTMSGYLGGLESKYGIETAALLLSDLYELSLIHI